MSILICELGQIPPLKHTRVLSPSLWNCLYTQYITEVLKVQNSPYCVGVYKQIILLCDHLSLAMCSNYKTLIGDAWSNASQLGFCSSSSGGNGHTHAHTYTHTHTHTHTMHVHTVPESLDAGKLVQSVKKAMQGPRDLCKICTCATTATGQQPHDEQTPRPLMSSPSPSPSPSAATTTAAATATSTSTDPLTTLRHLIIVEGTMILNIR